MRRLVILALLAFPPPLHAAPEAPAPESASLAGAANRPQDLRSAGLVKAGMELLFRPEAAANFRLGNFSFSPGSDEGRILTRLRPSVAVNPSENLSARVEGQWYAFRDDAENSIFSLYQGYVEGALHVAKGISLKAGRQELVYGSAFLLGADTFYDGLAFDAVKLSWNPSAKLSLDLFGGRYVKKWAGGIDGELYGIYAAVAPGERLSIDLYGFRDTGGPGATHAVGGRESTCSAGTRIRGKIDRRFAVELEPVYQFGRRNGGGAGDPSIRAYGGHADLAIDAGTGRHRGKIFLSYAYGSGDGNPAEGKFTEFHNPNNDTSLIGDMNVIGELGGLTAGTATASGLQAFTAGGEVDLAEWLNVSLNGHVYRAVKTPAGISREIGIETNLILTCKIGEGVSLQLSGNRLFTGDFFRDAAGSGKDIDYAYAQLQATF